MITVHIETIHKHLVHCGNTKKELNRVYAVGLRAYCVQMYTCMKERQKKEQRQESVFIVRVLPIYMAIGDK